MIASIVAFVFALFGRLGKRVDTRADRSGGEVTRRKIFLIEKNNRHHLSYEKQTFTDEGNAGPGHWPDVPDEKFPFLVEKVWESYR